MLTLSPELARFASVLEKLQGIETHGSYLKAKCPAHEDVKASLSISVGRTGALMLKCHAGCSFDAVCQAARIDQKECFAEEPMPQANGKGKIVKAYPYRDELGALLFEVCRFEPKDFRPRRPARPDDPPDKVKGGMVWNLRNTRLVLYRLPELLEGLKVRSDRAVFICEGEKDADRLAELGFLATTNAGGAGKWRDEYTQFLRGTNVVIVPDMDMPNEQNGQCPGWEHAVKVACALVNVAVTVRILKYHCSKPPKFDISDWLDEGHTADELRDAVKHSPVFTSGDKVKHEENRRRGEPAAAGHTQGAAEPTDTRVQAGSSPHILLAETLLQKAKYLPADDWLIVARHMLAQLERTV